MNLLDLNQITTPKEWKQRALSLGDPAPARHPKAKKKLVLAFVVLLCLVLGAVPCWLPRLYSTSKIPGW